MLFMTLANRLSEMQYKNSKAQGKGVLVLN